MGKIKKILISNRGEIAVRIIKTAKKLGIKTVALYSDPDREGLHVKLADEAWHLPGSTSAETYLDVPKILEACKALNVDAIHPGYGFLSENADFANKVREAGIIFIGPSAEAIETMGSKLAAKEAVSDFGGVPMVPGMEGAIDDIQEAKRTAKEIGFPVLIKASAGGGGKGMRVVENEEEFEEQMDRAISEATSAFGDGAVFVEKFIMNPKHIEIQILGDEHGNIIYLFERECSIQRRHQKVVEEAPSPVVDEVKRAAIGEAAVNVAKACGYYGAGTVEFIYDENGEFYFLEMNTRLQVEHPVTEEITGVDLVAEQINIAEGNAIPFKQEDLKINGHSIEIRVYAEDPLNNFLPDSGKLNQYTRPTGDGVRLDDGFEEGMEVTVFYDPMIAKLITHGKDRAEAIEKMNKAIDDYKIGGIATTLEFCRFALNHSDFRDGSFTTKFVEKYFSPELLKAANEDEQEIAALFAGYDFSQNKGQVLDIQNSESNWKNRL
ncbi:MAG: acetyl-CoA carboxylase biotin carboxylase subunit [bacterium]|nr:acetyl-CoA carboxylase biotin carboxylase subunit [bacterium]